MALVSIRFIASGARSFVVGSDVLGNTMMLEGIGSGGSGGTGAVFGGGGGKGGAYARRTSQAVAAGDILNITVPPTTPIATAGAVATVVRAGVTLLSARGGDKGANAGTLSGGAGATAQVGTFVGDVEFLGGNGVAGATASRGGGGSGAGRNVNGNNALGNGIGEGGPAVIQFSQTPTGQGGGQSPGSPFGGAGIGATTTTAGTSGAQGVVVLTYSTGVGSISHTAVFNRKLTIFRRVINTITHTAIFNRLLTVRRMFTASIAHTARSLKTIKLRRIASIVHTARQTTKRVRLTRIASIVHTPFLRRAIKFTRIASITHTARFQRLVTLRRRFTASIQHRARQLMKLEGRLIPREGGGGGTVIQVFRNLFLFDD